MNQAVDRHQLHIKFLPPHYVPRHKCVSVRCDKWVYLQWKKAVIAIKKDDDVIKKLSTTWGLEIKFKKIVCCSSHHASSIVSWWRENCDWIWWFFPLLICALLLSLFFHHMWILNLCTVLLSPLFHSILKHVWACRRERELKSSGTSHKI